MATDIIVWDYEAQTWAEPIRMRRRCAPMIGSYVDVRDANGMVRSYDVRAVFRYEQVDVIYATKSLKFYRQHELDPDHVAECAADQAHIDRLGEDSCPIAFKSIYEDLHIKIEALPKD